MKSGACHRIPMRAIIDKKDDLGIIYVKRLNDVMRRHVSFCRIHNNKLRSKQRRALKRDVSPSTATEYIQTYYKEVTKETTESDYSRSVWIEMAVGMCSHLCVLLS